MTDVLFVPRSGRWRASLSVFLWIYFSISTCYGFVVQLVGGSYPFLFSSFLPQSFSGLSSESRYGVWNEALLIWDILGLHKIS